MAPMPFLIAFAVAAGQVTFAGAVATPTATSVPVVEHASNTSAEHIAAQTGRFDGPPRMVSIQPLGDDDTRSEIVVTYL